MGVIIVYLFFSFLIIYGAVRLAIEPLINNEIGEERNITKDLEMLVNYKIISTKEFNEIKKFYKKEKYKKNNKMKFVRYSNLLDEFREKGLITETKYVDKYNRLKKELNITNE